MFPIRHSLHVNYPASCIPHFQLDSPALNQAHPVSLCIKPQCGQSCLLDCTGWFPQSFKHFSQLSSLSLVVVPVFCLFIFIVSPSTLPLSVCSSRTCLWTPAWPRLRLQPYVSVLQPRVSRYWPTPAHDYASSPTSLYFIPLSPGIDPSLPNGPALGNSQTHLFTSLRLLDHALGYNKPLSFSWTWSGDWFLYTHPDRSILSL